MRLTWATASVVAGSLLVSSGVAYRYNLLLASSSKNGISDDWILTTVVLTIGLCLMLVPFTLRPRAPSG
ncbi:MAG: hypothetical protein V4510_03290 [bacterium]